MNNNILFITVLMIFVFCSMNGFAKDKESNVTVQITQENKNPFFILEKNEQNPFEQRVLRFTLLKPESVTLCIFDLKGNKVNTLVAAELEPGTHDFLWDGNDNQGNPVKSGVYRYCLKTREIEESHIIAFLR